MSAPPDFRQRLENTNSRQGQPVKLIAVVTGNPTPVVQWYREGKCLKKPKFLTDMSRTELQMSVFDT